MIGINELNNEKANIETVIPALHLKAERWRSLEESGRINKQISLNLKLRSMKNKSLLLTFGILIIALNSVAQQNGTFIDSRDGKKYKTVTIGSQTWMAENLAFKTYIGCWAYGNDTNNVVKYGYLYNWETAKSVCPTGWHLPSPDEWTTLIIYLGGDNIAGCKLKATKNWKNLDKCTTNSSDFSALPGGFRSSKGSFHVIGDYGCWWSSKEYLDTAWCWYMQGQGSSISKEGYDMSSGYSVRCLKDK